MNGENIRQEYITGKSGISNNILLQPLPTRASSCISWDSACCHCLPFSHAEMAGAKKEKLIAKDD